MRKIPRSNEAVKVKSKIILLDELLQQVSLSSHSRWCREIPQEQTGQSCRGPVTHMRHRSPSVDSPSHVYKGLSVGSVPAYPLTADFQPQWLTPNTTDNTKERLLPSLEKLGIVIAFWTCAYMMRSVLCRLLRGLMGNIEVEKNIKSFPKQNHELELKCR